MYRFTLKIRGGPLHGREYVVESDCWPPPMKMMGADLGPYVPGTYEMKEHSTFPYEPVEDGLCAEYELKLNEDYYRLIYGMASHSAKRQCQLQLQNIVRKKHQK